MLELHTIQIDTVDATTIKRARKNEKKKKKKKKKLRGDKAEVPPWENSFSMSVLSIDLFVTVHQSGNFSFADETYILLLRCLRRRRRHIY